MKIQTISGETIDTNDQTDIDSEITIAVSNLFEICKKYDVPLLIRALTNETSWIGAQYMKENNDDYVALMLHSLDQYVSKSSEGKFRVAQIKSEEE